MNEINYHLSNEKLWGDNKTLVFIADESKRFEKKYITDACTVKPVKSETCVKCFLCYPTIIFMPF